MMWYFAIPTLLPESVQMWLNDFNAEFVFSTGGAGVVPGGVFFRGHPQRPACHAGGADRSRPRPRHGIYAVDALIILPQGIRNALPALINHTVLLFKNTSLAMVIGVADLTYVTREIENYTFRTFEAYLVSTLCYLFFSLLLMGAGALLAQRFQRVYAR